MKNLFATLLFGLSLFLVVPGCGSGKNKNVAEDADAAKLAEFEAAMKAEEEAGGGMEDSEKDADKE